MSSVGKAFHILIVEEAKQSYRNFENKYKKILLQVGILLVRSGCVLFSYV